MPSRGGLLRVYLDGSPEGTDLPAPASDLGGFLADALSETLVRLGPDGRPVPGLAADWTSGEDGSGSGNPADRRWTFQLDPSFRFADGSPVRAEDVIRSWEEAVSVPGSIAAVLLRPVVGVYEFTHREAATIAGLERGEGRIVVRTYRPTPDLAYRLAHPALAVWRSLSGGAPCGPGAFRLLADAREAVRNGDRRTEGPFLDRLLLASAGEAGPSALAMLGEIDLSVVYGRDASRIAAAGPSPRYVIERLPSWDRTYALWLSPASGMRWTRDPAFRAWVDAVLDRQEMVELLLDGRGEAARDLDHEFRDDGGERPSWKLPHATRPRLTISFDDTDAIAVRLAARVKADLESEGMDVRLEGESASRLRTRLADGSIQAALLRHQPRTPDPVLALEETLFGIGVGADDIRQALDEASLDVPGEEGRRRAAEGVRRRVFETSAGRGHRLVPLVRAHAWLVRAPRLVGVDASERGRLRVEKAGWLP